MDETAVLQLKQSRSRAKAALSTVTHKLCKRKTIPIDELTSLHEQLESTYDKFTTLHYEYTEAVFDDQFAEHRKVSNLNLDEYFSVCEQLYNDAIQSYATLAFQYFSCEANIVIKKAEYLLSQQKCGDFVGNHISIMLKLSDQLKAYPTDRTDPIVAHLDELRVDLECMQIKSTSESGIRVHVNQTSTSEPSVLIQSHTPPTTSATSDKPDIQTDPSERHIESTRTSIASSNPIQIEAPTHESTRSNPQGVHETQGSNPNVIPGASDAHSIGSHPHSNTFSQQNPTSTQAHISDIHDASIVTFYKTVNRSVNGEVNGGLNHASEINNSRFKFNKSPLPTFSGDRLAYGEFRSIWQMFAAREFSSDQERAWELKHCLKCEALDCIDSINTVYDGAYQLMWKRLDKKYCNTSLNIRNVYQKLANLSRVREGDMKGLVKLVNEIELCYARLAEIGHVNTITICQVDDLSNLLPPLFKWEWMEKVKSAGPEEQLHPFSIFMEFLELKRDIAETITESSRPSSDSTSKQKKTVSTCSNATTVMEGNNVATSGKTVTCFIHPEGTHQLESCRKFNELSIEDKYGILKEHHACYRCLKKHPRGKCHGKRCNNCSRNNHHILLCRGNTAVDKSSKDSSDSITSITSNHCQTGTSLLPIQNLTLFGSPKTLTVFFDGGSNASLITHQAAQRLKAKKVRSLTLDLTITGNIETQHDTSVYEILLKSSVGTPVSILAYGLEQITGEIDQLNLNILQQLFPLINVRTLQRGRKVDLLLGSDYAKLHPRREVAKSGDNLWILEGPLGRCLQGNHPDLKLTNLSSQFISIHTYIPAQKLREKDHVEFASPSTHFSKVEEKRISQFIEGENLGTELAVKCGGCKCNKCPIPGHSYSFKEEQELQLIRSGLSYDKENHHWITTYPWITDPKNLPDNYSSAFATLRSTEKTLRKDPQWAETYGGQIEDMVDRNVARKLTPEEIETWDGPVFYISHLAVLNPKSTSTPVRIVFNSSQVTQGKSLNSCLAKGPDAYINNLLGILLRWRQDKVAMVADIRKMYNSIHIGPVEQHCHRFLWRNLENREPDIYIITRVNMGDKPAAAISAEAIYGTADLVKTEAPDVTQLLKQSTYVDDIVHSVPSKEIAFHLARTTTNTLKFAGFTIKHWLFSGESEPRKDLEIEPIKTDSSYRTQVLGISWESVADEIITDVKLNFSPKKKGVYTQPNLTVDQIPVSIPNILTRRSVLEQTMKLYDPLGIYCAFTLKSKILLRETWNLELGWDSPLPDGLTMQWKEYFSQLFDLERFGYERTLTPNNAVGNPMLILLSDASDIAYGFVAYIRWLLSDGNYWCRFIMAKCRIKPLRKLSTPQMELCAAVLSKRGRKVIESECTFEFEKVYHLVDSETVLCSINKTSTRFKVFEGVRIAEIQAATNGNLGDWFWVKGKQNTADWLTRGKNPNDLSPDSEWWKGPSFLYQDEQEWDIKSHAQCVKTSHSNAVTAKANHSAHDSFNFDGLSNFQRLIWTYARVYSIVKHHTFSYGGTKHITPAVLDSTRTLLIQRIQESLADEIHLKKGRYSKLGLVKDTEGTWRIGRRLINHNPMTSTQNLQILLPTENVFTKLLMQKAHVDSGHRGRDATLARFRSEFWITQGTKKARSVTDDCQLCRVRMAKLLTQTMGELPTERTTPAPPFTHTMVDLFGPYLVRGEVNKRASGKVYGVLFTDLASRAVHIEPAFAYDTESFLMALQRFSNIRGWPQTIYSDPGSQLIGAEKELVHMWQELETETVFKISANNGTEWKFSPADSPWRQGAAEVLIKAAKRAIKLSIHSHRISPTEFLTLCTEITNEALRRDLSCSTLLRMNSGVDGPSSMHQPSSSKRNGRHQLAIYNLVM